MYLGDLFARALGFIAHQQSPHFRPDSSCSKPGLSCPSAIPSNPDTCCLNHPSGHFLLTQFWDASPPLGSAENWTIHGLWPDFCTGGFDQFCDRDREHSNIAAIVAASSPDLLSYMHQHWLSLNGDNNHLWAHEWNKHGTCISTLDPDCYPAANDSVEAITSYFTHAATLYSTLRTYATLAAANIMPSRDEKYDLEELQSAITAAHGYPVTFRCHGTELQEIWYHYSVRGPLRHAQPFDHATASLSPSQDIFVPTKPDISKSNCPSRGIRYLPKSARHGAPQPTYTRRPTHTSTASSAPTGPAQPRRPFSGRGHLLVRPISTANIAIQNPPATLQNRRRNPDATQQQHPFRLQPQPQQQQQEQQQEQKQKQQQTNQPSEQRQQLVTSAATRGCLIRGGLWYTSGGCATYLAQTDPPHFGFSSSFSSSFSDSFDSESESNANSDLSAAEVDVDAHQQHQHHMFTLSSLYAPCAIVDASQKFVCAQDLGVQAIFEGVNVTTTRVAAAAAAAATLITTTAADAEGTSESEPESDFIRLEGSEASSVTREVLAWRGKTTFYADRVPGKFDKVEIFADDDAGRREVAVQIEWEAL